MGHIDEVLKAHILNQHFSPPIWAVLTIGKCTLTHYYNKTNLSDIYQIAIGVPLLIIIKLIFWSCLCSSPSSPQAHVLQKCWVVRKLMQGSLCCYIGHILDVLQKQSMF